MLVKIFQNRHPELHASSVVAFFAFSVVIFFTLLGIVSRSNSLTLSNHLPSLACIFHVSVVYIVPACMPSSHHLIKTVRSKRCVYTVSVPSMMVLDYLPAISFTSLIICIVR